jgi:hypothetical protein
MCTLGGAEQGRNTHWLLHFSNAVMCIFRRYPRAYLLYLLSDLLLPRLRESAIRYCIFVLAGFFRALFVAEGVELLGLLSWSVEEEERVVQNKS